MQILQHCNVTWAGLCDVRAWFRVHVGSCTWSPSGRRVHMEPEWGVPEATLRRTRFRQVSLMRHFFVRVSSTLNFSSATSVWFSVVISGCVIGKQLCGVFKKQLYCWFGALWMWRCNSDVHTLYISCLFILISLRSTLFIVFVDGKKGMRIKEGKQMQ